MEVPPVTANNARESLSDDFLSRVAQTNCFEDFGVCTLIPPVALANHSCVPNAIIVSVGNTQILRAAKAIREGEEVNIAYFEPLKPFGVRSRLTSKCWGFHCGCPRCKFERALPEKLQEALSASDVDNFIKDSANGIDVSSIECQWLRASHANAYVAELEKEFPYGDKGEELRDRFLRSVEATAPASFTHVKHSWFDWCTKSSRYGPREQQAGLAARYTSLVHRTRYGPVPNDRMQELLRRTQAAMTNPGIGVEFCNPEKLALGTSPPSVSGAPTPSQSASGVAGGLALMMLD